MRSRRKPALITTKESANPPPRQSEAYHLPAREEEPARVRTDLHNTRLSEEEGSEFARIRRRCGRGDGRRGPAARCACLAGYGRRGGVLLGLESRSHRQATACVGGALAHDGPHAATPPDPSVSPVDSFPFLSRCSCISLSSSPRFSLGAYRREILPSRKKKKERFSFSLG